MFVVVVVEGSSRAVFGQGTERIVYSHVVVIWFVCLWFLFGGR